MEWLTEEFIQNAKQYDGDQWTGLTVFNYDGYLDLSKDPDKPNNINNNYTYYKLEGGDWSGIFEDFKIIIKAVVESTDKMVIISPINVFSQCVRTNEIERKEMPYLFLVKFFKSCVQYYTLENNFSMWNNTSKPQKKELKFNGYPPLSKFNENELNEINKAFQIISRCKRNTYKLDFNIIKHIELYEKDKHSIKCVFCNNKIDVYLYHHYLKNNFMVNDNEYPCIRCKCSCYIPQNLRKCQTCNRHICDKCKKQNNICGSCELKNKMDYVPMYQIYQKR